MARCSRARASTRARSETPSFMPDRRVSTSRESASSTLARSTAERCWASLARATRTSSPTVRGSILTSFSSAATREPTELQTSVTLPPNSLPTSAL